MATAPQAFPHTRKRHIWETSFRFASLGSLALIVGPAMWILIGIVVDAVPHWKWNVLTTSTQGSSGGLENAILGTLVLMAGVLVLAGGIGISAGIYLAELVKVRANGKHGGGLLRSATNVLAGFPSIVLGYVGYVALVLGLHWGFSLMPALIILSMMVVPYITRSTESAIRQVPRSYREGAEALGMTPGHALRKVVLRSALPGIVTGLLIALAISSGELAPLLLTAGWTNSLPSASLVHHQVAYLTYPIWTFYNLPYSQAHYLAYDAALLLIVMVLLLLTISRIIVAHTQRHSEGRNA